MFGLFKKKNKVELVDGKIHIPKDLVNYSNYMEIELNFCLDKDNAFYVAMPSKDKLNIVRNIFDVDLKTQLNKEESYRSFPFKLQPWDHQLKAMMKADFRSGFAYFMEQGTGKTKASLDEAQVLFQKEFINNVLIVCPKSLMGTWRDEVKMHLPEYTINVWKQESIGNSGMTINIINVDALKTGKGFEFAMSAANPRTLMILDESTSIKNLKAKRTAAVLKIGQNTGVRRILTGTPITKNPLDLYSQLLFLDPWFWKGSGYYSFRSKYAVMGGYQNKQVVGFKNLKALVEQIDEVSFRVTKDECLDLPPKVYSTRYIELTKSQKTEYKRLRQELGKFAVSESTGNVYNKTMVTLGKMHQLVGGNLDGVHHEANKIVECVDILREGSGKTLIWCKYIKEIERLKMTLEDNGFKVGTYHGSVSIKKREQNKLDFNEGDMDVLILQYACGGVGLTLNSANTVIFYSNDYTYADRVQAEDRCHRGGQTKSINYIDLVCDGTIDDRILAILRNKKSLSEEVMNNLGDSEWMNF
mgnify:CR=1 FL=1